MKITQFILLSSTLLISANTMAAGQQACLDAATTQLDMNQCSGVEHKDADAELNRVYGKIKETYKDDKLFLKKLKQAQLAWIKLRDADFALKYPHADERQYYGSIFPTCAANYKTELTWQRVVFLKQWLAGVEEGDVCSGSIKPK